MGSSKTVNELRKAGKLDEAYSMAVRLYQNDIEDYWISGALIYCINDLIKRSAANNDYPLAQRYASQLDRINYDQYDEILNKTINKAKLIADPGKKIILEAREFSFQGNDEAAYPLFKKAFEKYPTDVELAKSFGWTLCKLIKKAVDGKQAAFKITLLNDCSALQKLITDEKLLQSIQFVTELADDERQIIRDANEASKAGNHEQALSLFRLAIKKFPEDKKLHEQFAWELYKEAKIIFGVETVNILAARKLLAEYIKLNNPRPSQMHSLFLWCANKIADKEDFGFIAFLQLWDLKHLRVEDFDSQKKEEKVYPGLAERVIQNGAKLVLKRRIHSEADYLIPFLSQGIKKFPANIWLTYYNAKLLHLVHRNNEAIEFLIPVIKEKIGEYWTWSLLAELVQESDKDKAISCYCKALLCKAEDKFLANVRANLADLLITAGKFAEAKCELTQAISCKEAEGLLVPTRFRALQDTDWFKNTNASTSNSTFYNANKKAAEELIFDSLPWLEGCLGESFILPDKPGKPRRKIYVKAPIAASNHSISFRTQRLQKTIIEDPADIKEKGIVEVVVSDKKFGTDRNCKVGGNVKVKGEYKDGVFQIYLLERNSASEPWNIFHWRMGNVVHEILKEGHNTGWRVSVAMNDVIKEGIINTSMINDKIKLKLGTPINVKLFLQKHDSLTSKSERVSVFAISERPDGVEWDCLPEEIGLVEYINSEKGKIHFTFGKGEVGYLNIKDLNGQVDLGTVLRVRQKKISKGKDKYYVTLTARISHEETNSRYKKEFDGDVRMVGNVGFVDDVFIDSSLIRQHSIVDDTYINGTAVLSYNRKKNRWGWKAVKIEKLFDLGNSEEE